MMMMMISEPFLTLSITLFLNAGKRSILFEGLLACGVTCDRERYTSSDDTEDTSYEPRNAKLDNVDSEAPDQSSSMQSYLRDTLSVIMFDSD